MEFQIKYFRLNSQHGIHTPIHQQFQQDYIRNWVSCHLLKMNPDNQNNEIQTTDQTIDKKQIISSDSDKTSSPNDQEYDKISILQNQKTQLLLTYLAVVYQDIQTIKQFYQDLLSIFFKDYTQRNHIKNCLILNMLLLKTRAQKQRIFKLVQHLYDYFLKDQYPYKQLHYYMIMKYLMQQNDEFLNNILSTTDDEHIGLLSEKIKNHILISSCENMKDFQINQFISMFTRYKWYQSINLSNSEDDTNNIVKQLMENTQIYNCVIFDIKNKDYLLAVADSTDQQIQHAFCPGIITYNNDHIYDVVGFLRQTGEINLPQKIRALHIVSVTQYQNIPSFNSDNLTVLTLGNCVCPDISKCVNLEWIIMDGIKGFSNQYLVNLRQLRRAVLSRIKFQQKKGITFQQQCMQLLQTLIDLESMYQIHLEFVQLDEAIKISRKLKHLRMFYIQRASIKTLTLDFDHCSMPKLELLDIANANLELIGNVSMPQLTFLQCNNKEDIMKVLK